MRPPVPEHVDVKIETLRKVGGKFVPLDVIRHEGLTPEPKGGATFVQLYCKHNGAFLGIGRALCRDDEKGDNFNATIGRDIATGRALKVAGLLPRQQKTVVA